MRGMYNELPRYVIIKKKKIKVNTDFRIFIDFEQGMISKNKKKEILNALSRFYPAFFPMCEQGLLLEAIDGFLWFYHCGKKQEETKKTKSKVNTSQIYSYKHDDLYIWGTFNQCFNVDLTNDEIHWWKFRAMWLTIPSNSVYSKIKSYRGYTGNDKEILDLKESYKLPPTEKEITDQIRRDKIFNILK